MGKFHPWRKLLPRKHSRPSPSSPPRSDDSNDAVTLHGNLGYEEISLSKEEMAAITIQACFRAHLARRAYKALRSLVRLQAVVRGVIVRRQARIALDCMHALARLQITVRARQLLLNS